MPSGKTQPRRELPRHSEVRTASAAGDLCHHLLFTFVSDSGGSVTGNGIQGFKVAKVVRCR
jgi:hypothetical protein